MKRGSLLLVVASNKRKNKLMNLATTKAPSRRNALLKLAGPAKRIPTNYYNRQGRQFFLTASGKYVIRTSNGKTLYGRKSTNPRAPLAIRPVSRGLKSHPLRSFSVTPKYVRNIMPR
ncbi:hypothetical protein EBT25_01435 [bacterium]|nr:hypothetical protein [bacterium]